MTLKKLKCAECKWTWWPRKITRPRLCPKCKSRKWHFGPKQQKAALANVKATVRVWKRLIGKKKWRPNMGYTIRFVGKPNHHD